MPKCINIMSYSVTLNIEKAASAKIYTCIEGKMFKIKSKHQFSTGSIHGYEDSLKGRE